MNGPALVKYVLYGVLGMELAFSDIGIFMSMVIVATVIVIENLAVIQSRRF